MQIAMRQNERVWKGIREHRVRRHFIATLRIAKIASVAND